MTKPLTPLSLCLTLSITTVLSLLCATSCFEQNTSYQSSTTSEVKETVTETGRFLRNTTYIYNEYLMPTLTDYSYTPPQSYRLNSIEIAIKNDVAVVTTDVTITHKIISAEYYTITDKYSEDKKLAILKTNKGEIRLAETHTWAGAKYYCWVQYGDYEADQGGYSCILPNSYLPGFVNRIRNNMKK